jgi:gamma-glutamyltranspeptidase / glutathione hydrolase
MPHARTRQRWICGLVALLCAFPAVRADEPRTFSRAVVAADHPAASEAGVEILRQGGNVVDAAVATGFALSVVRPASSGIGGGGFMVIWDVRRKRAVALDYREQAPAAAARMMYVDPADPQKVLADASRHGGLAIAVPAHVAGLCRALHDYGTLDLKTVLGPALRLCREGVPVDAHDRYVQREVLKDFERHPEYRDRYASLLKLYLNQGVPWREGERFYSPLQKVLEQIAESGEAGFYRGPVAQGMVAEVQRCGGRLTVDDLAAVRPQVRETLQATYGPLTIHTMPPPSSGGVALLETLNQLESLQARFPESGLKNAAVDSPLFLHALAESFKQAFADRAALLGDADFVKVPVERLTSRNYSDRVARRMKLEQTRPPEEYGSKAVPDDGGTTHFSILDNDGNAVACTETINTLFGSYVVEPQYGIVLNNEMDDFTALPGVPNAFGLIQSEANAIAPGKRPLSSMTPTIVVHEGTAQFVVGASGGPRIISATTQVLLRMMRFGESPAAAVDASRLHHQWFPNVLELEAGGELVQELERRQHIVQIRSNGAVVQAVRRLPTGQVQGASDRRKGGRPAGF